MHAVKGIRAFLVGGVALLSLAGCARQQDMQLYQSEIDRLHTRVTFLERELSNEQLKRERLQRMLEEKEKELLSLPKVVEVPVPVPAREPVRTPEKRDPAASETSEKGTEVPRGRSHYPVKSVQLALQKAGFDPGPVDGKMGSQTTLAIRAFQKDNGLKVDGIVGKETWEKLKPYLPTK